MSRARIPIPEDQIAEFCRRNQVRSLALFGSVLRADFRPDSDVDVLVEFGPDARWDCWQWAGCSELAALFHHPVDLVPKDGLKPRIREAVLASTEVLYAG
jgi:predicted nucleotidyltransferase